jgi:hypothetical protein
MSETYDLMDETYARGGGERTAVGGFILVVVSLVSAVLLIGAAIYASGASARNKAGLALAGCEPNLSPSGDACTNFHELTNQYLAIANPVTQQLATSATAYAANENLHLAAAETALTADVAAESTLAKKLAVFPFPPAVAAMGKTLIHDDQAVLSVTTEQARSSSLTQLRSFNARVAAANRTFLTEVKLVRKALDTKPTASQEP